MPTRREFLATSTAAAASAAARPTRNDISLAAWSINRSFFGAHRWKNLDLPKICREQLGIKGIEFVNQFFENPTLSYLNQLKKAGADAGAAFVLIMVDSEGDMASSDQQVRRAAAIAHRKWIDAAHYLGCHGIRCNLGGPRTGWKEDKDLVKRAAESFRNLLDYSESSGLNVMIENHGGASSNPQVLLSLMKTVNHPRFGTLPDFGNINPGDDNEEVVRQIVPYAKGISVKASWDENDTHSRWNLENLIAICQKSGYTGFWGIESGHAALRNSNLSADQIWEYEIKAIKLTKAVLERMVMKA